PFRRLWPRDGRRRRTPANRSPVRLRAAVVGRGDRAGVERRGVPGRYTHGFALDDEEHPGDLWPGVQRADDLGEGEIDVVAARSLRADGEFHSSPPVLELDMIGDVRSRQHADDALALLR